ncbi:MFS transporter [Streptomyces cacaoi]|uniref:MFS transporter n=1 Tax=Streptomyces cacaoi TaxID=1898 RepID=A0A4Y3QWK9_STRCI|nr:MFS transporter [Streptomyces cacaoi]NNG85917.1 MFS transporter [Streptomyces cacaoi]GEB49755.1 MFS transporter [Streptomyces cacaoi]
MLASSSSPTSSYAAVLRTPHACRTFGAALSGRLSYGMLSLSGVLAVGHATGSYATAGTVMGAFWLTGVALSPARAALLDRYGIRRALPWLAGAYAVLLTGLALTCARSGAPGVLLLVVAMAAGALTPPLGPVMRTLWSELLPDRRLLRRAYSLDAVAEELLLVSGPLLVGALLRVTVPAVGLVTSATLALAGSLALVSSPPVRHRGRPMGPEVPPGPPAPANSTLPGTASSARWRPRLRGCPGTGAAIIVAAGLGMCLGSVELLVIAFADDRHRPETVAWVLAALSAGSVVGGLAHGAVPWRAATGPRLSLLAAALGVTLATAGLAPHLGALAVWTAAGGLFVAPALSTAYLLADESATAAARTRAGAWVNSAFNAGSAVATAATGWLLGRLPLPWCFPLAAAPAVLAAVVILSRSRSRSRSRRPAAPAAPAR